VRGVPLFTWQSIHRNISLVACVFLVIHIVTAVVDPFSKLSWLNAIVPFTNRSFPISPLWIGSGVVAMELIATVVITSLLRHRLSPFLWRSVHWLSYAGWVLSVVHGLGGGTDASHKPWALGTVGGCCLAVGMALVWRMLRGNPVQV
jgi:methionine sulfoxide reductase heme-binding subunit